ncbi:diaminopimelate epimerase [Bifidobacterium simiiventris]|uniref:diaminopimelate epimerase n=1 Tax=Bifidobacterium simiiventris TaxID=2834434 RepID=UPI001C59D1C7|nr:diaminopimelate epimerase [Bifidobacterium simiiventris]MBW3078214.1 diaminopimelate epimerase [Bifidobacterium simiiventris]
MSIPHVVYKAHATGNDFVVYADPTGEYEPTPDEVRFLCDRHFGIGGDGLIRLAHPGDVSDLSAEQVAESAAGGAEWFMDYRNADGSLAEMCGNGTRAITLFAQRQGYAEPAGGAPFRLGTRAGVKTITSLGAVAGFGKDVFQVDMGAWKRGETDAFAVTIPGTTGSARGTFVDMGNPHVVAVIEDSFATLPTVEELDLVTKPEVSPVLESDQNVEFVRIDDMDETNDAGEATMRVNERGCGETLSCGTGLCATAVTLRAKTGIDHWTITVRGGTLRVDVTDEDVKLTGAATLVGRIELL